MPVESDMAVPHTIEDWFGALGPMPFAEAVRDAARTVVVSADMIVGFCDEGPLASPRIGALKTGVARLFRRAHDAGIRHFVLLQDTHDPDAIEFDAFPVHCVRGTHESDTVEELRTLPFSDLFTVVPKNTLTPAIGTTLESWLDTHDDLSTAIVVGDCTDFCVYQAAMYLRLRANARATRGFRVIVPAELVDTYDVPPGIEGAKPHGGDFFHRVFLYHMAVSGVDVVRALV